MTKITIDRSKFIESVYDSWEADGEVFMYIPQLRGYVVKLLDKATIEPKQETEHHVVCSCGDWRCSTFDKSGNKYPEEPESPKEEPTPEPECKHKWESYCSYNDPESKNHTDSICKKCGLRADKPNPKVPERISNKDRIELSKNSASQRELLRMLCNRYNDLVSYLKEKEDA